MVPDEPSEFGALLTALRKRKGITALELSRRAAYGMNYVRNVERGLRRPSPQAVIAIAEALRLSPEDREKFYRQYDADGKKPEIQAATAGPAVPGVVLWRHLPELLYGTDHDAPALLHSDPDQVLFDVVRSAASLLAWVALLERPPSPEQLADLRAYVAETERNPPPTSLPVGLPGGLYVKDDPFPHIYACTTLPRRWREMLFRERESAQSLVDLLAKWVYQAPLSGADEPSLTFSFTNGRLQESYGFEQVGMREVVNFHDGMIACELLAALQLPRPERALFFHRTALGPLGDFSLSRSMDKIRQAMEDDFAALDSLDSPDFHRVFSKWQGQWYYARFARRIFLSPNAADYLFSDQIPLARQRVFDRWLDLPKLLGETIQSASVKLHGGDAPETGDVQERQQTAPAHAQTPADPPPADDPPAPEPRKPRRKR